MHYRRLGRSGLKLSEIALESISEDMYRIETPDARGESSGDPGARLQRCLNETKAYRRFWLQQDTSAL